MAKKKDDYQPMEEEDILSDRFIVDDANSQEEGFGQGVGILTGSRTGSSRPISIKRRTTSNVPDVISTEAAKQVQSKTSSKKGSGGKKGKASKAKPKPSAGSSYNPSDKMPGVYNPDVDLPHLDPSLPQPKKARSVKTSKEVTADKTMKALKGHFGYDPILGVVDPDMREFIDSPQFQEHMQSMSDEEFAKLPADIALAGGDFGRPKVASRTGDVYATAGIIGRKLRGEVDVRLSEIGRLSTPAGQARRAGYLGLPVPGTRTEVDLEYPQPPGEKKRPRRVRVSNVSNLSRRTIQHWGPKRDDQGFFTGETEFSPTNLLSFVDVGDPEVPREVVPKGTPEPNVYESTSTLGRDFTPKELEVLRGKGIDVTNTLDMKVLKDRLQASAMSEATDANILRQLMGAQATWDTGSRITAAEREYTQTMRQRSEEIKRGEGLSSKDKPIAFPGGVLPGSAKTNTGAPFASSKMPFHMVAFQPTEHVEGKVAPVAPLAPHAFTSLPAVSSTATPEEFTTRVNVQGEQIPRSSATYANTPDSYRSSTHHAEAMQEWENRTRLMQQHATTHGTALWAGLEPQRSAPRSSAENYIRRGYSWMDSDPSVRSSGEIPEGTVDIESLEEGTPSAIKRGRVSVRELRPRMSLYNSRTIPVSSQYKSASSDDAPSPSLSEIKRIRITGPRQVAAEREQKEITRKIKRDLGLR